MSVPSLSIKTDKLTANSKAKIEALQHDLQKLDLESSVALSTQSTVPTFQRQGYLEKLGHSRHKWFKRFFVLRDSMLLSYNLAKSDFTTEPRSSVHLGNCKVVCCSPGTNDRDFCFSVLTETGDQFLFSATSEIERQTWVDDILNARLVTHANMVKLAVENQCLAEEKGLAGGQREVSTNSLAIFSNPSYVQDTPLTGGMEGWLSTTGFNITTDGSLAMKKAPWKRNYFMLRDSHLLMFHPGDILSKPRGVMYLVGTVTELLEDPNEVPFRFCVRSRTCGDIIELASSSQKSLLRWKQALTVGSRVTYPDYRLLEKERRLLATVVLTPRAPTPRGPGGKTEIQPPPSVLDEEVDIQGNALPPGAVQPYDEYGNPYLRRPDGMLVDINTGKVLPPSASRFSSDGEPLDSFNRPLPPNAVAMFDKAGRPIGVGPDGLHYTADGENVDRREGHYDSEGKLLDDVTVQAADQVAPTIAVAMKVRARLKGNSSVPEIVDPLGRTFKDDSGESLTTQDGEFVPKSARRIEVEGKLVSYEEAKKQEAKSAPAPKPETGTLFVKMESEFGEVDLGVVEVSGNQTLANVRTSIASQLHVPEFVFLQAGVPLTKLEEKTKLAIKMGEITIRGQELKVEPAPTKKFATRIAELHQKQQQIEEEESEFLTVMNKVKQGGFLRSVGRDLTK